MRKIVKSLIAGGLIVATSQIGFAAPSDDLIKKLNPEQSKKFAEYCQSRGINSSNSNQVHQCVIDLIGGDNSTDLTSISTFKIFVDRLNSITNSASLSFYTSKSGGVAITATAPDTNLIVDHNTTPVNRNLAPITESSVTDPPQIKSNRNTRALSFVKNVVEPANISIAQQEDTNTKPIVTVNTTPVVSETKVDTAVTSNIATPNVTQNVEAKPIRHQDSITEVSSNHNNLPADESTETKNFVNRNNELLNKALANSSEPKIVDNNKEFINRNISAYSKAITLTETAKKAKAIQATIPNNLEHNQNDNKTKFAGRNNLVIRLQDTLSEAPLKRVNRNNSIAKFNQELNNVAAQSKEDFIKISKTIEQDLKETDLSRQVAKALEFAKKEEITARKNADAYVKQLKELTTTIQSTNSGINEILTQYVNLGKKDDAYASTNVNQIVKALNEQIDEIAKSIQDRNAAIALKLREEENFDNASNIDAKQILALEVVQLKNTREAQIVSKNLLSSVRQETIALNNKLLFERRQKEQELITAVLLAEQEAKKTDNYDSQELFDADRNLERGMRELLLEQARIQAQQELKVKEVRNQVRYLQANVEQTLLTSSQLLQQRDIARQTVAVEAAIGEVRIAIANAEKVRSITMKSLQRKPVDFANLDSVELAKFIDICRDQGIEDEQGIQFCVAKLNDFAEIYNASPSAEKFTLHGIDANQSRNRLSAQILSATLKSREQAKEQIQEAEIEGKDAQQAVLSAAEKKIEVAQLVAAKEAAKRIRLRDASRNNAANLADIISRAKQRNDIRREAELAASLENNYRTSPSVALEQDIFKDGKFGNHIVEFKSYFDTLFANAGLIKAKEFSVRSAETALEAATKYYIPKVSATAIFKYNPNNEGSLMDRTDKQFTATSTVLSDQISTSKSDAQTKVSLAELDLRKEKERLVTLIISNLISIDEYTKLMMVAQDILGETKKLYEDLLTSYNNGVARESDVQNAELLYQRINTEIASINREIINLKDNIQSVSGLTFPEGGIKLPKEILNKINNLPKQSDVELLANNIDIKQAQLNADLAKYSADNQVNNYNVSVMAQQKFTGQTISTSDSYIGLQATFNIFDYQSNMKKRAGYDTYLGALASRDFKVREIKQTLSGLYNNESNNQQELKALELQEATTRNLIDAQEREYQVNNTTLYQMLNSKFDLFTTQRSITEKEIITLTNKIQIHQTFGRLLPLLNLN